MKSSCCSAPTAVPWWNRPRCLIGDVDVWDRGFQSGVGAQPILAGLRMEPATGRQRPRGNFQ